MSHASGRSKMGNVHLEEQLPKPEGRRSTPTGNSTRPPQPEKAPAQLQLPDLQEVAPHEPMTSCMQRIRAGEPEAMADLYRMARPKIAASLARILPCDADSEDVIQTTLLSVWRKAGTFHPGAPVMPWLCGIARRAALDLIRTRARRQALFEKNTDSQNAFVPSLKDERREIQHYLEQLPDLQKQIINLSFFKNLPLNDIAEKLEISLAQARTLRRKALNSLKEKLKLENL